MECLFNQKTDKHYIQYTIEIFIFLRIENTQVQCSKIKKNFLYLDYESSSFSFVLLNGTAASKKQNTQNKTRQPKYTHTEFECCFLTCAFDFLPKFLVLQKICIFLLLSNSKINTGERKKQNLEK